MFMYDVTSRRDGIIKAYLRGDITEIIIKNVATSLSSMAVMSFFVT